MDEQIFLGLVVVVERSLPHPGATRDLVLEDETGYAVDFDDTDAVVDRLARLRRDPGRIEYMGSEARNRIRDHFTLDHSGKGWVKLVRGW